MNIMVENNNYCVILAGGLGSRFWPLSRKTLPKQFLDFFGTGRTLLQQTYDRYCQLVDADHIFVVTNTAYTRLVVEQLPEVNIDHILSEPLRRNTAPCIAWAAYHIRTINPKANIVVAPADQLILKEKEFLTSMLDCFDFVSNHDRLLCVGIPPSRPETRYGYIQIGDECIGSFHAVKTFTEKPETELAKVFVESGEFYWNAGIFLANVEVLIEAIRKHIPKLSVYFDRYEAKASWVEDVYPSCPNISVEYGILEKADNVYLLAKDFGWSDIGTWSTYYDALPKEADGNVSVSGNGLFYECSDCIIASDKKKLVIVKGLNDYLVADSENVLLICPKNDQADLRKYRSEAEMKMGEEYV